MCIVFIVVRFSDISRGMIVDKRSENLVLGCSSILSSWRKEGTRMGLETNAVALE